MKKFGIILLIIIIAVVVFSVIKGKKKVEKSGKNDKLKSHIVRLGEKHLILVF